MTILNAWARRRAPLALLALAPLALACGDSSGASSLAGSDSGVSSPASAAQTAATADDSSSTTDDTGGTQGVSMSGSSDPLKYDVGTDQDFGDGTTEPPPPSCKVVDDMNAGGACGEQSPPDSFEPDVQWTWTAPDDPYSVATPLVANFTDDNGDGEIDLCDKPDILISTMPDFGNPPLPGHLYLLDGETGALHFKIEEEVVGASTPAIGDIDGDGLVEIVHVDAARRLVAYEHDGTKKWTGPVVPKVNDFHGAAVALADVDNDGDVEIAIAASLFTHQGALLWSVDAPLVVVPATTLADLDGDDDLEVIIGASAYHHDGSLYFSQPALSNGYPQVANLDDDPQPEILLTNYEGITVLEHDGAIKFKDLRPTGDPPEGLTWSRPATIHDLDGDGVSEFALSSSSHYAVYERDATLVWTAEIEDPSGIAAGTAFDFLGDGVAEAMYADEFWMFIYDGAGQSLLQVPRTSRTLIEYPVVADVDNDGSAEIVVVSNETTGNVADGLTVQVIRDKRDRWIQARRIWNQHTYHVTNVREDGTIPQVEPRSWEWLNTFRTNAQIEGGGVCKPPPPG
ncbi:MAG: VCBS repeat-containing protein [Myxococcales bacterium]|nr:VCBS repeat-containing protein [Myxococcales bacterium]